MCLVLPGRTASASAASRRGARRSSRPRRTRARRPTRSPSATRRRRALRPAARVVRPCVGCGRPTRSRAPAPAQPTSASAGTLCCSCRRAIDGALTCSACTQAIGQQLCEGVAQLPPQPEGRRCALQANLTFEKAELVSRTAALADSQRRSSRISRCS